MLEDMFFRILLAALAGVLFYNEHVLYKRPIFSRRKRATRDVEFWLSVAAWSGVASLLLYLAGVGVPYLSAPLPVWVRWVGAGLMLLCIPLSWWVHRALGKYFSPEIKLREDHRIVKEGPFAYVRHPMYLGLLLCAGGACLVSANYLIMAATLLTVVVIALRIKKEEAMLLDRFGDEYRAYMRATGSVLPKFAH